MNKQNKEPIDKDSRNELKELFQMLFVNQIDNELDEIFEIVKKLESYEKTLSDILERQNGIDFKIDSIQESTGYINSDDDDKSMIRKISSIDERVLGVIDGINSMYSRLNEKNAEDIQLIVDNFRKITEQIETLKATIESVERSCADISNKLNYSEQLTYTYVKDIKEVCNSIIDKQINMSDNIATFNKEQVSMIEKTADKQTQTVSEIKESLFQYIETEKICFNETLSMENKRSTARFWGLLGVIVGSNIISALMFLFM